LSVIYKIHTDSFIDIKLSVSGNEIPPAHRQLIYFIHFQYVKDLFRTLDVKLSMLIQNIDTSI
jgi:hypothetical protein